MTLIHALAVIWDITGGLVYLAWTHRGWIVPSGEN